MSSTLHSQVRRFLGFLIAALSASALYLYAFPSPSLIYMGVVMVHALLGLAALAGLVGLAVQEWSAWSRSEQARWFGFGLAGALGVVLLFVGTARPEWRWLYAHEIVSVIAVVFFTTRWLATLGWSRLTRSSAALRTAAVAGLAVLLVFFARQNREGRWHATHRIQNPASAPESMDQEGDGPRGRFFPSSAQTVDSNLIPGQFFMESESCKRCHQDIYNQWYSSAHHFSSFNNQWYRKSIEYMQEVVGTRPSKWCGGCHDPAVLFSGMMDTPIQKIVNTPEAQAGLGCVMCHSIARVKSSMGQGDFVLEYPRLHDLAASRNPVVRTLHDYLTHLNPEPHRRVFLKPFMRSQPAEFCSTCHKVHLDVPVNHYRWIRGFNEYDNWQASGVSGQGARAFYYPEKSATCSDCHMPAVASRDDGQVNGLIHSHGFPAANSALPTANEDAKQLALTENFLKGTVSVDIFALSPARELKGGVAGSSEQMTTFAVGEEAEVKVAPGEGSATAVTAPLNRISATVRRGDNVLVDVVVRTRKVGHFFPAGTVDAYDTWVELRATDESGRVVFWSGKIEENGKGPVEKGAHFYRSLMVDANGNAINKRNAWAARALVYVRLIPPGAADTVHFQLHIPENAGSRLNLEARLLYRKFSWWNTHFAYAGVPDPSQAGARFSADFDDRNTVFRGDLSGVSGKQKRIPDLPAVVLSEDKVMLSVSPRTSRPVPVRTVLDAQDWTRWNDYGIGLLLQGDLKGAAAAFAKITQINPSNPDGWVNLGRVAVQEGDMETARRVLERALRISPALARAHFFYARMLRNVGRFDEAEQHLRTILAQFPRDRVVRNDLGRILFLRRQYTSAIAVLNSVLEIDPEDLQAHYNLMLCYQGLGKTAETDRERRLYLRFKADEASQTITGPFRRMHPEDNNERQAIHAHVSAPLVPPPGRRAAAPGRSGAVGAP